ncbi:MAG: hypothetical protein KIS91_07505 [Anaerolineae bacterium]|nr:hypothetical protein [Anaerolineae bacterium]
MRDQLAAAPVDQAPRNPSSIALRASQQSYSPSCRRRQPRRPVALGLSSLFGGARHRQLGDALDIPSMA